MVFAIINRCIHAFEASCLDSYGTFVNRENSGYIGYIIIIRLYSITVFNNSPGDHILRCSGLAVSGNASGKLHTLYHICSLQSRNSKEGNTKVCFRIRALKRICSCFCKR